MNSPVNVRKKKPHNFGCNVHTCFDLLYYPKKNKKFMIHFLSKLIISPLLGEGNE